MSEITEATQIVALAGSAIGASIRGMFRLTTLGIDLFKAIRGYAENRMHQKLCGEVSLEQLARFEGTKLSSARFENITMDELRPMLDSYGIPYVVMPDTEINGIKYTTVTFGNSYTNRMAAVLQSLGGNGEILTEKSIPKYITSGEVSFEVLQQQDGPELKPYQFKETELEKLLPVFNRAGLKYAVMPDLNLGDGLAEVAFPASQRELVQKTMERIAHAKPISMQQYFDNANPRDLKAQAAEYDATHNSLDDRKMEGATQVVLDQDDFTVKDDKVLVTFPETDYTFEVKPEMIADKKKDQVTLLIRPADVLVGHVKPEAKAEKLKRTENPVELPDTIEIGGDMLTTDLTAVLLCRQTIRQARTEEELKEAKEMLSGSMTGIWEAVKETLGKVTKTPAASL